MHPNWIRKHLQYNDSGKDWLLPILKLVISQKIHRPVFLSHIIQHQQKPLDAHSFISFSFCFFQKVRKHDKTKFRTSSDHFQVVFNTAPFNKNPNRGVCLVDPPHQGFSGLTGHGFSQRHRPKGKHLTQNKSSDEFRMIWSWFKLLWKLDFWCFLLMKKFVDVLTYFILFVMKFTRLKLAACDSMDMAARVRLENQMDQTLRLSRVGYVFGSKNNFQYVYNSCKYTCYPQVFFWTSNLSIFFCLGWFPCNAHRFVFQPFQSSNPWPTLWQVRSFVC